MFVTLVAATAKVALVAALSSSPHPYTVAPGDTLSGIAASHGVTLAAVEQANPQLSNPNVIVAGQVVNLVPGSSTSGGDREPDGDADDTAPAQQSAPVQRSAASPSSVPSTSGDLASIPGVPRSFAQCIAFRESTNGTNPAAHGNVYGLVPSGGHDGTHMSLAQQKQVVSQMYAQYGTAPWQPYDGCK